MKNYELLLAFAPALEVLDDKGIEYIFDIAPKARHLRIMVAGYPTFLVKYDLNMQPAEQVTKWLRTRNLYKQFELNLDASITGSRLTSDNVNMLHNNQRNELDGFAVAILDADLELWLERDNYNYNDVITRAGL